MVTQHSATASLTQKYIIMAARKAIFLDKDGTLVPDLPYNVDADKITISPDAITGLKALHEAGYLLIIISNQSGIAKGFYDTEALSGVEFKIQQLLQSEGLYLTGFYFCPHDKEGSIPEYRVACKCQKPQPGLILEAAQDHDIDLAKSWMIGDILNDVEAGHRAGCEAILINNGNETEWEMNEVRVPDVMVKTLDEAAAYILNRNLSLHRNNEGVSAANR